MVTLWQRRELILAATGAILGYQPILVASVVEGLVQGVGYGGLFGHIFRFSCLSLPEYDSSSTLCYLVLLLKPSEYHPPMSAVNGDGL
jgi:hypothetical protein